MNKRAEFLIVIVSVGLFALLFQYLKDTSTTLSVITLSLIYIVGIVYIFLRKAKRHTLFSLVITFLFVGALFNLL
ncbi:hypothetical protein KDN24_13270 [Bacillus sp. Bva_UNVM-123]|uniref:hypothetical protein n=1 Tax=Bacillus sp. Bva_UNVM-123 TaxID=2829798 RepID=UPI00391F2DC3